MLTVVQYLLCLVWPTRNQKKIREMGLGWEEMSEKEIVAADGTVITTGYEGYPDPNIASRENSDEKFRESDYVESKAKELYS